MKNILVTGSNGFIGSHLIEKLGDFFSITASSRSENKHDFQPFVQAELKNAKQLKSNFPASINTIIHCAGQTGLSCKQSIFDENNYLATKNLVDLAIENKVEHFIFFSTPSMYMSPYDNKNIGEEDIPSEILTSYAKSKIKCEKYLEQNKQHFTSITIIRPGTVYGPGNYLLGGVIQDFRRKKRILRFNSQATSISMTYIDNLIHAIKIILQNPVKGFNIFNLADEEPISMSVEFLQKYFEQKGIKYSVKVLPFQFFYQLASYLQKIYKVLNIEKQPILSPYIVCNLGRNRVMNTSKFKKSFPYHPLVNKEVGIKRFNQWMTDNIK